MSNTVDDRWNRHNKKLDSIANDSIDFLQHPYFRKFVIMPLRRNTDMCEREIAVLKRKLSFNKHINVIEVGAGFGNFCRVLCGSSIPIKNYTIVDTASMLRFSTVFLNHFDIKCNFIDTKNYKSLLNEKFDLFISNICLSEIPEEHRKNLLDTILPNCNQLYVIDGCSDEYNVWLKNKLNEHFTTVDITTMPQKICLQKFQFLHIGKK